MRSKDTLIALQKHHVSKQAGRPARSSGPETMSKDYVIRSRKGCPRLSRILTQPQPFSGLAGEELHRLLVAPSTSPQPHRGTAQAPTSSEHISTAPQYWLGWWLRTFFPPGQGVSPALHSRSKAPSPFFFTCTSNKNDPCKGVIGGIHSPG